MSLLCNIFVVVLRTSLSASSNRRRACKQQLSALPRRCSSVCVSVRACTTENPAGYRLLATHFRIPLCNGVLSLAVGESFTVGTYLLTKRVYEPLRHFVVIVSDVNSRTCGSLIAYVSETTFYFDSKHLEFSTFDLILCFIAFAKSTRTPGEQFCIFCTDVHGRL